MKVFEVIKYPLMTERSVTLIESENKLTFVVNLKASKKDIRRAIEELYDVEVESVNTLISPNGEKRAFVKLYPEFNASDVAVQLGIL
ncbi:MAG: 50S ribosomal protein L23 [Candidatus Bathyarchaeota archaeon]|nr:MAG: 50S ribosomal protein L23 [Candidatus Bathyarchaeota archaeon]